MTSQQQDSLTEQWEAIEETDRERAEEHAADTWDLETGPAQRTNYIADALEQWDDGADERRERFLDAGQDA